MTTTTRRQARPHKPAAAPFSPAASKLNELIQSEARAKVLEDLSAKDTIIVLHGFDAETKRVQADGCVITIFDSKGNHLRLQRHHVEPEAWRGHSCMAGHWHPARWYGQQTLVDASGNAWERELNVHVCDDFGNLVEVA